MPGPESPFPPKVEALAAEAVQLVQRGQRAAAAGVWERVLAHAPQHPGALNFFGTEAFSRGNLAEARDLLDRATAHPAAHAMAFANLARVRQAQGDLPGALEELDRALKREPNAYAVHFEKAKIYGLLDRGRDQALAYESGLQLLPAHAMSSPELHAIVLRAQDIVARNKAGLGEFLEGRLADLRQGVSGRALERFDECLDISLGRKPVQLSRPAMFHVPGLPAIAFFDRADFAWAPAVEACTDAIRAELEQVSAHDGGGFVPYVQTRADEPAGQFAALDRNPDWSAYFLWHHGKRVDEHVARCPATMAMLEGVPQVEVLNRAPAAFFSALKPRTRIPPHHGATNCRLTVHLPLVIPPDCGIRVGNHVRQWTPGELLLFDDTIEHAAWNDSDQRRVVLIFDVWHPMLSETERALVRQTLEGIMAWYGKDAPLGEL